MTEINWEGKGTDDLMHMMSSLNDLIKSDQFDQVDEIISTMDLKTSTLTMLSGVLRFTGKCRDSIPSWEPMRDKLYDEILFRDENPDDMLMGLFDK